uniref:Uncharacterized mitochondrial protein AtMg00810-like n=1 Tax=Tanacetum cinerariifolium TaxID=118510 RepID=A0A699K5V3_TANCI|nr:uncharacterized mitochondrial protein AtMg00810-like [Tanacetum cinerariifolium]
MLGHLAILEVLIQEDDIFFNQSKYIKEMLKKFGLEDSKPMKTPMSSETKLTRDEDGEYIDDTKYNGMIGSLLYLMASMPDIMFRVSLCACFQEDPKTSHLEATKKTRVSTLDKNLQNSQMSQHQDIHEELKDKPSNKYHDPSITVKKLKSSMKKSQVTIQDEQPSKYNIQLPNLMSYVVKEYIMVEHEESVVYQGNGVLMVKENVHESIVQSSGCLFKTIKSLFEFKDMVRFFESTKPSS